MHKIFQISLSHLVHLWQRVWKVEQIPVVSDHHGLHRVGELEVLGHRVGTSPALVGDAVAGGFGRGGVKDGHDEGELKQKQK